MKIVISLFFFILSLVYIFYAIDFTLFLESILSFSIISIVFLVLFNIISLFLMAYRFTIIYNKLFLKDSFRVNTVSMGINQIAPARGGDLIKPFMIKKITGSKISSLFAVLSLERFLDICVLFLVAMFIMHISINIILLLVVLFIVFFIIFNKKYISKIIHLLKTIKYKKIRFFLIRFYISLVRFDKIVLIKSFSITVIMYFFYLMTMFLFIKLFTSFDLSFFHTIKVFVISTLGLMVPSVPASIGTFEASIVFALDLFDISKEQAFSFALVYHFMQIITILFLTGIFLLKEKYE